MFGEMGMRGFNVATAARMIYSEMPVDDSDAARMAVKKSGCETFANDSAEVMTHGSTAVTHSGGEHFAIQGGRRTAHGGCGYVLPLVERRQAICTLRWRRNSRRSSANKPGCSVAMKCPPRGNMVHRCCPYCSSMRLLGGTPPISAVLE
jgi:hypothetical protein